MDAMQCDAMQCNLEEANNDDADGWMDGWINLIDSVVRFVSFRSTGGVLGEGKIRTTVVVVVVVVARRANLGRMNVTRIDIEATSTSTSNRAHRHRRVASGMVGKDCLLPGGWKETNERTMEYVRGVAWRRGNIDTRRGSNDAGSMTNKRDACKTKVTPN